MASPKKQPKPKRNPKRLTDKELLKKIFPKEVLEDVETQLQDSSKDDE